MLKACRHGEEGSGYCRERVCEVGQGVCLCGERRLLDDLHYLLHNWAVLIR